MTAQTKVARYVCLGCGSEGLLRGEAVAGGRARCPHCGRLVELDPELEAGAEAAPDSAARLLPAG